ncbi:hypothetical protein Poli38472_004408 [Pythium oligandrum]|uniref:Aldehyde dehydrogenase n=1 Tax=Pythium oligandrum TaxID=41045 RepID=A0A8K1FFU6_PYTOL|nr:hypothetical protein Poli38472_004408 [Pythium oligandrum]|eukprot:TMW59339.1 hypothetical protein Poli38472_004408 [Pythium oligandrum]
MTSSPVSPATSKDHQYIAVAESSTDAARAKNKFEYPLDAMYGSILNYEFPDVTKQDTAADVQALRETFRSGATRDLKQRRELLLQLQRLMKEGEAMMKEAAWKDLHKHPTETYACEISLINQEIQDFLDHLEDWSKPEMTLTSLTNLPGLSYICRDPLGVVCVVSTWNYPINLLFMPLIPALAAGNCVLLRLPGDDTTRYLNNVFITLLDKYMDKRFVRYVYGGVEETKAMLRERYDLIFATGGGFLGKIIARSAAEYLTPMVLELGGKSPAIIDETVDITIAARRLTWGAFTNAGQTCVRPDYLLVDERVGDKLVAEIEKNVRAFYGEDPKESNGYGRIVNARAFARLNTIVQADKARITFGGVADEKESYISPTMLNFKTDLDGFVSSKAMEDELFGPLLPIYYYPAGKLQAAIDFVSAREKPLALYFYSTNSKNKQRVVRETTAGSMVINDSMMQLSNPHLPFGGVGSSGMGAYHGRHGFDAFSHRKAVMYKYSLLDLPARYMPYTAASERMLRLLLYPVSRRQLRVVKLLGLAVVLVAIGFIIKAAVDN